MKKKSTDIPHYALSPRARAGLILKRLGQNDLQTEHDHAKPHRDSHYLLMFATAGRFQLDLDFSSGYGTSACGAYYFSGPGASAQTGGRSRRMGP